MRFGPLLWEKAVKDSHSCKYTIYLNVDPSTLCKMAGFIHPCALQTDYAHIFRFHRPLCLLLHFSKASTDFI
jgi:hypothetical protein